MRALRGLVVTTGVAALALAACGSTGTTSPNTGGSPSVTANTSSSAAVGNAGTNLGLAAEQVSASDQLKFSPESITAHVGDIIKWTNTGSIPHTVTFDRYASLSESVLNGGASWEVTFTTPGTYAYHCIFHQGMTGTVTVQ